MLKADLSILLKYAAARRTRIWALIVAGAIGMFAFSADMLLTAGAAPGTDEEETPITPEISVDLDSLYSAKASEDETADSSYVEILEPRHTIEGHVSWYGGRFHGRKTANGERFDMNKMTAAHKKLPFNTIVRVVDTRTGKAVLVRINDRGPYIRGRVLDLSREAASRLGMKGRGTTSGRLEMFNDEERTLQVGDEEHVLRFVTFDRDVNGAKPNGWSVMVIEAESFDEAVKTHNGLTDEYDKVFLTRVIENGDTLWRVSVGLYDEDRLSRGLHLELVENYTDAVVIQFQDGFPEIPALSNDVAVEELSEGESIASSPLKKSESE